MHSLDTNVRTKSILEYFKRTKVRDGSCCLLVVELGSKEITVSANLPPIEYRVSNCGLPVPMGTCLHHFRNFVAHEDFHSYFDRMTSNNLQWLHTVKLSDMAPHWFEAMSIRETSEVFFQSAGFCPRVLVISIRHQANQINLETLEFGWLQTLLDQECMTSLDELRVELVMHGTEQETLKIPTLFNKFSMMKGPEFRVWEPKTKLSHNTIALRNSGGLVRQWEEDVTVDEKSKPQAVRHESATIVYAPWMEAAEIQRAPNTKVEVRTIHVGYHTMAP